jgi:hypothetical protein
MALSVRLALVSASDLADGEVKLRTFRGVHKLGTYDGIIRLARAHLGRSAALVSHVQAAHQPPSNIPLWRPFFCFVLATTSDTIPSGASPATELLARMRSRALMCGREGLDGFSSICFGVLFVKLQVLLVIV